MYMHHYYVRMCECVYVYMCAFLLCPDLFPGMSGAAPPIPSGGSTEIPPTGGLEAKEREHNHLSS